MQVGEIRIIYFIAYMVTWPDSNKNISVVLINLFSVGAVFIRQNLTSLYVRL